MKNKILTTITFILFFSAISYANDWKCEDNVKVKYKYNGKDMVNNYDICHADDYFKIVSKKVYEKRGRYFRKFRDKMSKVVFKRSQFGSPHFQKCILSGGDAKLVDIYLEGKWEEFSLCFFESNVFISTHYLTTF